MRIVCQKCSAAYAIDDKLVTPKGIRAQCPRCRHLQLVKKDDAPATTEPAVPMTQPPPFTAGPPLTAPPKQQGTAAAPDDLFFDFSALPTQAVPSGGPPPPPPGMSMGSSSDVLDFSDLAAPPEPKTSPRALAPLPPALRGGPTPAPPRSMGLASGPPPAPAPSPQSSAPFDFSGDFSFSDPAPAAAPPPAAALRARPDSRPPPPPSVPRSQLATAPAAAAATVKCKTCGKVLTDPFDQALGICDDCRNRTANELSADDSSGKPTLTANQAIGRMSTPAKPLPVPEALPPEPVPLEIADSSRPKLKKKGRNVVSAYRPGEEPEESSSTKFLALGGLLLAVFVAGGVFLYVKKPWVKRPPPLAQKLPTSASKPIEAMVERWKAKFGDTVTGSAAEHLAAGEEKLALDTTRSYAEAEDEFQKALVLDKSSDRAIAGWALAMSFGRGDRIDAETQKMAESMLIAAEQRGGDARVYVAHAHLLLARGANLNDVQVLAERGKSSPSDKDKALGYLALGQAYLTKNTKTAEDNFREAVKADPKLKRAYLYQVRLMLTQGDYRGAALTLEKRLEADPDQWEATDTLAKLYIELGDVPAGKRTYFRALQAAPTDPNVRLALGVIAYQHEGDLAAAADRFDNLFLELATLDPALKVSLLGHRAALKRLQGDNAGAIEAADAALAFRADDVNAHLQKLFADIAIGNIVDARANVPFVKMGDAALDAAIDGRVLLAEDKPGDALEKLKKAIELDPRRIDATLLAAGAAVKAHQEGKGWELALAKALRADPQQSGPRQPMSSAFTKASDFIGPARGIFAKLAKDKEDPNPFLAEGAMAWHAGEYKAADEAFAQVIVADPTNAIALAYRALVAARARDYNKAGVFANKAVGADRASALALYSLGLTQFLTGKVELARKTLRDAADRDPKLFCARTRLAEADVKVKKVADARASLTLILSSDPAYTDAKRVLYGIPP